MKDVDVNTQKNKLYRALLFLTTFMATIISAIMFSGTSVRASGVTMVDPNGAPQNISQNLMIDSGNTNGVRPTITSNISGAQYFSNGQDARNLVGNHLTDMHWWPATIQGFVFKRQAVTSNSTISVEYPYVGKYHGRRIGVKVVISNILANTKYDNPATIRSDNAVFGAMDTWYNGFARQNINREQDNIKFYYQDNHELINFPNDSSSDAYMSFNSLNGWWYGNNFTPQPANTVGEYVGQIGGLNNVSLTKDTILLQKDDPLAHTAGENQVFGGKNYDFEDTMGSPTFDRATAMYQLSGSEQNFILGTTTSEGINWWGKGSGNPNWNAFSSAPIGNVPAPVPSKAITDVNGTDINGKTIYPGQTLVYNVSQKTNNMGVDILKDYKSFEIKDNLDHNLSLQKAEMVDSDGNSFNVNEIGTLTNNNNQVDFKADIDFLQHKMVYDGRTYTLKLTVKINDSAPANNDISNVADSNINGYSTVTNPVNNRVDDAKVTTNYLDETTGRSLSPSITTSYPYGANYSTNAANVTGYHVSRWPSNAQGAVNSPSTTVNYYYNRDQEQVHSNYIANNDSSKQEYGQTLAPSETYTGLYGDPYSTINKTIDGWHLLFMPSNATGNFTINTPDVNYIFDRDTEVVTVHYVDVHGKKLAENQTFVGLYGLPYSTQALNINNYHLTQMPDNASGNYGMSPIDVTYVYDENPSIKEGVSSDAATASNYKDTLNTTSKNIQYSNTYHYVSQTTVGGSMTLDNFDLQTNLTTDINPIVKGGSINDQNIKIYRVDNGSLTDITSAGQLTYQVNGKDVKTSSDPNVAYDLDKTRTIDWKAYDSQSLVGQQLVMDVPVTLRPDSTKLKNYRSNSNIAVANTTTLHEKNDISTSNPIRDKATSDKTLNSNTVSTQLPNIYTVKAYKSVFNTGDKIKGTLYFKMYNNLVANKPSSGSKALTLSMLGGTQDIDLPLSNPDSVISVKVATNTNADNHPFTFSWRSNQTSQGSNDLIMTKSLIKSENNNNGVTETTYNDDANLYSSSNTAVQNKPTQLTDTNASGVDSVEAYYRQDKLAPQMTANKEMTPVYVKLMEYMHANYNPSVSAKSGYGIKNDVTLNYYGRHLNDDSENDFITNQLASTFTTDQDMTAVKGKSSSQIQNNRSERLDYDVTTLSASQVRSKIGNSNDKTAFVNTILPNNQTTDLLNNQMSSDYMWDQAGDDPDKTNYFNTLSSDDKNYVLDVDTDTQSSPRSPLLYEMAYKFNKRLLNNGIEYYDTQNAHVSANNLQNSSSPAADAQNGGYLFYTNQWLPLGKYGTTYQSNSFGSNEFVFKLSRQLDIYGHRYLAKGDGPTGDTYDDLAIQPVISNDLNKSNTTFSSNDWSDR